MGEGLLDLIPDWGQDGANSFSTTVGAVPTTSSQCFPSPCAAEERVALYPPLLTGAVSIPAWGGAAFSQLQTHTPRPGEPPSSRQVGTASFHVGEFFVFLWVEHLLIFLYIFTTVYIFIGYFYQGFLDYVHLFCITCSLVYL